MKLVNDFINKNIEYNFNILNQDAENEFYSTVFEDYNFSFKAVLNYITVITFEYKDFNLSVFINCDNITYFTKIESVVQLVNVIISDDDYKNYMYSNDEEKLFNTQIQLNSTEIAVLELIKFSTNIINEHKETI